MTEPTNIGLPNDDPANIELAELAELPNTTPTNAAANRPASVLYGRDMSHLQITSSCEIILEIRKDLGLWHALFSHIIGTILNELIAHPLPPREKPNVPLGEIERAFNIKIGHIYRIFKFLWSKNKAAGEFVDSIRYKATFIITRMQLRRLPIGDPLRPEWMPE